jgi:3-phenylpropionate/trans-cinnamate dioxygenase ferredoxin reductase subunit
LTEPALGPTAAAERAGSGSGGGVALLAPPPVAVPRPPAASQVWAAQAVPTPIVPHRRQPPTAPRSLWLVVYLVAILGPLALAHVEGPPGRSFALELGSSLGIVALSLLALQLVLPARLRLFSRLGADVAVRLHRRLADLTLAMMVAHIAVVIVADHSRLGLLAFVGEPWRAQAGIGSFVTFGTLFGTSMFRRHVRLSYAAWRGIHVLLGCAALLLAVAHTIGVGRYLARGVAMWALVGLTVVGVGGVVITRLWRPRRLARRSYVVERVVPEIGGATTLVLRAHRHHGHHFNPGQFAWLKLSDERYRLTEHPFSYSSSALKPQTPSFTIKAYGGFSADVDMLTAGTELIVDGPHGSFRIHRGSRGVLLLAGGIGITPCMSILRTAADRGERRRYLLMYGSRDESQIIFGRELEELSERLDLTVVHVLSEPSEEWAGERGFMSMALLDRSLPDDLRKWEFFMCGPPPMAAGASRALDGLGIPKECVHIEQFVEV